MPTPNSNFPSKSLTLFLTLALLLFSTCKKEDQRCPCQYEQGFQQVKDWMYFKTGSYWIYEEENTGAMDTLTVWEDWQGVYEEGNGFYTYTVSSYDDYFYRYEYHSSFTIHCINTPRCQCEKVDRGKSRPGHFVGSGWLFVFPPILNNPLYVLPNGASTVTETYPSYGLGTLEFANVVLFHSDHNASEGFQETKFFLSKHIGIIRKELLETGEMWNLIEYDVIQ